MTDLEYAKAVNTFLEEILPQLGNCCVDFGRLNALAMESSRRLKAPKCYTVLLDYASEGNHLNTVEAANPEEAAEIAKQVCAADNDWEFPQSEELEVLLIIEGSHQDCGGF